MYRSDDDIALLTELAGVLDQTIAAGGLSAGTYLLLRELVRADPGEPVAIGELADRLGADGDEVAEVAARLVQDELATARPNGVTATDVGRARAESLERAANDAIRAYVMERPHTATIYGLVASMQSGRFTIEDLIAFIAEGPTDPDAP
jgi:DNA-binding MarR family transcriptional regulator